MSYSPDAPAPFDPGAHELDQEAMELLGPDCRGIGAFAVDSLGIEKFFVNGVAALAVAAITVAGGVKVAREILGR